MRDDPLYAGGWTRPPSGSGAIGVLARWDGENWMRLDDSGINCGIGALAVFDDGTGPALYIYANCDASTTAPVLNVDDFTCFINAYAGGCP